jgi:hypothetical protein
MGLDNLWPQAPLYNKSYLINFKRWNYNYAFYYYNQITFYIHKTLEIKTCSGNLSHVFCYVLRCIFLNLIGIFCATIF